jgi:hypothetical protein
MSSIERLCKDCSKWVRVDYPHICVVQRQPNTDKLLQWSTVLSESIATLMYIRDNLDNVYDEMSS